MTPTLPAIRDAEQRATLAAHASDRVRDLAGDDFEIAIILGSGLSELVAAIEEPVRIPYADLPGFPASGVSDHAGELVAGTLRGRRVICFAGRAHFYEHGDAAAMAIPIDVATNLGCRSLILTNASGSTREDRVPGSLCLIRDHINFSGRNPLIGIGGDDRFVDMGAAYDPELRRLTLDHAKSLNISLTEGVYMWFSGPSFETPAEVRAAGVLGADLVGMSTAPEVILARHRGLRSLAISVVTNFASGLDASILSHEQTQRVGRAGAAQLALLLPALIEDFPS
jgi:purine-nucleoside phosphorylase